MSPPLKRKRYSLAVGIMDLPSELKQMVISLIPPAERRHLRLVDRKMLDTVAMSMRDVLEIAVSFKDDNDCRVLMTTVNPYTGTTAAYDYKIVPSSLSFLLYWAGVCTKSLSVTTSLCFTPNYSRLDTVRRVLEALNSEDACPKLMQLSVTSCRLVSENVIILGDVLKYVTKRQKEAATATDRSSPFLRSLSLIVQPDCCHDFEIRMLTNLSQRSEAFVMTRNDLSCYFSSDDAGDEPTLRHAVDRNMSTRILLQKILDYCQGLKVLNVDSLLKTKSLPVAALVYPSTLTHLKTVRLEKSPDELRAVIDNCPHLQISK